MIWDGLVALNGLAELHSRHTWAYEVVRETLMEFLPLFRGEFVLFTAMLEMIQLLTVLSNMTFKASMDGELEVSELSCWVCWKDIVPQRRYSDDSRCDFHIEIQSMCLNKLQHSLSMVVKAEKTVDGLKNEVCHPPEYTHSNLRLVGYVLRDLKLALEELNAESKQSSASTCDQATEGGQM